MIELNKIYNEDCLVGMCDIPDESIDLVVTDCPYKIVSGGCTTVSSSGTSACGGIIANASGSQKGNKVVKDGKLFTHNDISFGQWLPVVYRKLKPQAHRTAQEPRTRGEGVRQEERRGTFYH